MSVAPPLPCRGRGFEIPGTISTSGSTRGGSTRCPTSGRPGVVMSGLSSLGIGPEVDDRMSAAADTAYSTRTNSSRQRRGKPPCVAVSADESLADQSSAATKSARARISADTRSPPSDAASAASCAATSASSRDSRALPASDRWTTTFRPSSGSGRR